MLTEGKFHMKIFKQVVLMVAVVLLGAASASADIFLLDFNTSQTTGGYPAGNTWNVYPAPANITGPITNTAGSAAAGISISLKAGSVIADSATSGNIAYNPTTGGGGPEWLVGPSPYTNAQAAGDYFFTANNGAVVDSFTIVFSGLTIGDTVSIDLWASREAGQNGNGRYSYSLDGGLSSNGFFVLERDGTATSEAYWTGNNTMTTTFRVGTDAHANGRYMSIGNVLLTGTTLELTVRDDPSDPFAILSAMRISVVPEPSSLAVFLLAGAVVSLYRRRRS